MLRAILLIFAVCFIISCRAVSDNDSASAEPAKVVADKNEESVKSENVSEEKK